MSSQPACNGSGPNLGATLRGTTRGKPPNLYYWVDLSVKNPLSSAVWLFFDAQDVPGPLTEAQLWSTRDKPPGVFWFLSGTHSTTALRLPPGADILVRDVELTSSRHEEFLPLAFASELRIEDAPASEWLEHEGVMPASGAFTLDEANLVAKRTVDEFQKVGVGVDLICMHQVDVRGPTISR